MHRRVEFLDIIWDVTLQHFLQSRPNVPTYLIWTSAYAGFFIQH